MKNTKNTLKNTLVSLGLITSLLLATGCEDKANVSSGAAPATAQPMGPSETGGGNANRVYMEGMEDLLVESIHRNHNQLVEIARSFEKIGHYRSIVEASSDSYFDGIKQKAPKFSEVMNLKNLIETFDLTENGKLLVDAAKKLDQPLILKDAPCKVGETETREASSTYPGRICISVSELSKTTRLSDVETTVKSLLMHELVHKAGLMNERHAQFVEAMYWFLNPNIDSSQMLRDEFKFDLEIFTDSLEKTSQTVDKSLSHYTALFETHNASLFDDRAVQLIRFQQNTREVTDSKRLSFINRWSIYLKSRFSQNGQWVFEMNPEEVARNIVSSLEETEPSFGQVPSMVKTMMNEKLEKKLNLNWLQSKIEEVRNKEIQGAFSYLFNDIDSLMSDRIFKAQIVSMFTTERIRGLEYFYRLTLARIVPLAFLSGSNLPPAKSFSAYPCDSIIQFTSVEYTEDLVKKCEAVDEDLKNRNFDKVLRDNITFISLELNQIAAQVEKVNEADQIFSCLTSEAEACEDNYGNNINYAKILAKVEAIKAMPVQPSKAKYLEMTKKD